MYNQVCTRPDIAYIVGMLDRYLSNQGWIIGKQSNWPCGIYREQRITCSDIGERISWRFVAILISILLDAKTVEDHIGLYLPASWRSYFLEEC